MCTARLTALAEVSRAVVEPQRGADGGRSASHRLRYGDAVFKLGATTLAALSVVAVGGAISIVDAAPAQAAGCSVSAFSYSVASNCSGVKWSNWEGHSHHEAWTIRSDGWVVHAWSGSRGWKTLSNGHGTAVLGLHEGSYGCQTVEIKTAANHRYILNYESYNESWDAAWTRVDGRHVLDECTGIVFD